MVFSGDSGNRVGPQNEKTRLERKLAVLESLRTAQIPGIEQVTANALRFEASVMMVISQGQSIATIQSPEMKKAIEILIDELVEDTDRIARIKTRLESETKLQLDDSGLYEKGFAARVKARFGRKPLLEDKEKLRAALRTMLDKALRELAIQQIASLLPTNDAGSALEALKGLFGELPKIGQVFGAMKERAQADIRELNNKVSLSTEDRDRLAELRKDIELLDGLIKNYGDQNLNDGIDVHNLSQRQKELIKQAQSLRQWLEGKGTVVLGE